MRRRDVLKLLSGGVLFSLLGPHRQRIASAADAMRRPAGLLSIYNVHTNEALKIRFLKKSGGFDPIALKQLSHLFRCHYSDEEHEIDPRLFVLLERVRFRLGVHDQPFHLISGYRSPEYNRYLRKRSRGVASKSYHLKGMAADVCIEDVPLKTLARVARGLRNGGVGRYASFVHLDVGPVRYW
jgi:uncharacterized protein YcbK (DUF882 family)